MAPQVKTILLAVDFSETAQYLAEYASLFAKGLSARIVAVYVSPSMNRYANLYVPPTSIQALVEQILEGANRVMGEFMADPTAGTDLGPAYQSWRPTISSQKLLKRRWLGFPYARCGPPYPRVTTRYSAGVLQERQRSLEKPAHGH